MTGRRYLLRNAGVAAALLLLLAATTASAYVPMGAWNAAANLAIAAVKIGLVAGFFMHLNRAAAVVRLAAVIGLAMLAIFLALASADYLTRRAEPAPWQVPRAAQPIPAHPGDPP